MRRGLCIALVAVLLLSFLPFGAMGAEMGQREEQYKELSSQVGSCGANLTYIFDAGTGTITIYGSGAMTDYSYYHIDGGYSTPWYGYASAVKEVIIEAGVSSIGDYAFAECSSLTKISIPETVLSIGKEAFTFCGMESLRLPDNITEIGSAAFQNCRKLASVNIPNGIDHIASKLFHDCSSLESITLPEAVTSIGANAFSRCSALNSLKIPAAVTEIGNGAFAHCGSLMGFTVPRENPSFTTDDKGVLFSKDGSELICCPGGYTGEYVIPEGVVSLRGTAMYYNGAFAGCEKLTKVTIANSVKELGNYIFEDCIGLETVMIPKSISHLSRGLFSGCTALREVNIPESVISMDENAFFDCASLTSLSLPHSVASIGIGAFSYCSALRSINIPEGVTSIPERAFFRCGSLESIRLPESVENIGNNAFYNCTKLVHVEIRNPACSIYSSENTLGVPGTTVIYCGSNSTAQRYATRWGYAYDLLPTHSYTYRLSITPTEEAKGEIVGTCTQCGTVTAFIVPELNLTDYIYSVLTTASCREDGKGRYTWKNTEYGIFYFDVILERAPHSYSYTDLGVNHSVYCSACGYTDLETHSFTQGECACGAVQEETPDLDSAIVIGHTLNLASDISVNYAVKSDLLTAYDSYYLEVRLPVYSGNVLTGNRTVTLQPVQNGSYYYFTLTGITAVQMQDTLLATLYMSKDGRDYASHADSYSIATYAYNQLNKGNASKALKTLCADLLRYGAAAQTYKGYRTDALATDALTGVQQGYLSDLNAVTFGNTNTTFNDLSAPMITWAGKALNLDSKVVVKFIFDVGAYTGDLSNLTLRLAYRDNAGTYRTATLTNPGVYDESKRLYAFDFDGLMAAELRTALSATIYAGSTQVSRTLQYSADTYGNNKTGTLLQVCKALFAYSDSAKAYFVS